MSHPGTSSAAAAPAASRASAPRLPTLETFSAFKSPAFRLLWTNTFVFSIIQATQRFAFVWLVLDLGRGSSAAGGIAFALGIPVLFVTIPAGVLADRIDKRMLVLVSQLFAVLITLLAAILVFADAMAPWVTFALAMGVGATVAIGLPVRNAIIPSVIERDRLMNAIVMMSLSQNFSQIAGPAFAGVVIAIWGIGGAFVAQAIVLLIGTIALIPLRVPRNVEDGPRRQPLAELGEGLRFVTGHRGILTLVLLLCASGILMIGPFSALLPQIAKEELGQSAFMASLLFAFMGAGMMISSLGLASAPGLRNKGGWFIGTLMTGGVSLTLIGLSPWYAATAAVMFFGGMGGGIFMNLNQTLIQANTPQPIMGRVMSIHTLAFMGVGPFGALIAGAGASALSAPTWMAISGIGLFTVSAIAIVTQPALRRMS